MPAQSRDDHRSCSAAPAWYRQALGIGCEHGSVTVAGCPISYLAWGRDTDPLVVLIHGGAAHSRWWSHVGPLLTTRHRVVALDLSGHGDSGWRAEYSFNTWADEVIAVARAAGSHDARPVVVGHSMGGLVAITLAAERATAIRAAIIVDVSVRPRSARSEATRRRLRARRSYESVEAAVSRFRLVPDQPVAEPWILEHVARHSVRAHEGGATWKFDPRAFQPRLSADRPDQLVEHLRRVGCPIAIVRAEHSSSIDDESAAAMRNVLADGGNVHPVPDITIPAAYHHIMLDQPMALTATILTLLACWDGVREPDGLRERS